MPRLSLRRDAAPTWARFITRDTAGAVVAHAERPTLVDSRWVSAGDVRVLHQPPPIAPLLFECPPRRAG